MAVLGIVPARGGSKRIPMKNIALVNGRPMMANILLAARESGIFDKVHVSTDNEEIALVAKELGFKPEFMRDCSIADDYTPLQPVLKWVLAEFESKGEFYDTIFLLMPSAILVDPSDLKKGLQRFNENNRKNPLMAMAPYSVPVEWAYQVDEVSGLATPINPKMINQRSQDLESKYYDAGLFDIYSSTHLMEEKKAGEYQYISLMVETFKAIDIDSPEDLFFAETVLRGLDRKINQ